MVAHEMWSKIDYEKNQMLSDNLILLLVGVQKVDTCGYMNGLVDKESWGASFVTTH